MLMEGSTTRGVSWRTAPIGPGVHRNSEEGALLLGYHFMCYAEAVAYGG